MDKKILLVHPEVSRNKYNFNGILENEPLELEYLSAVLKQEGYAPEIFDVPREAVSLEEKLREYRPDVFYICGRIKQERVYPPGEEAEPAGRHNRGRTPRAEEL